MSTFTANRLSEGNKLFPATITVDEFGVTLKIPGVFSGKEKTLSFREISSVSIDSPMVGFSKITFNTLGFDRIHASGFSKDDAKQIKDLVQRGISGNVTSVRTEGAPVIVTNAAADQAKAEADRLNKEIELTKLKHKQERITELRSQGKTTQAFIYEYGTWLGLGGFFLVMIIFILVSRGSDESRSKDAAEVQLNLERIEDSIKIYIKGGDQENALRLTNELAHPLHEIWKSKSTFSATVYYDEYWDKKREEYKAEIHALGNPKKEKPKKKAVESKKENSASGVLSAIQVNEGYAVLQLIKDDGSTVVLHTDLTKATWDVQLISEDGYSANPMVIGKNFKVTWAETTQLNDATGDMEHILSLTGIQPVE